MSECIEFAGRKGTNGYGQRTVDGKNIGAHRAAWIEQVGPISEGLCVLHRCDNPTCINVDHLFLGTVADNNADMYAKRRRRDAQGRTVDPEACWRGHPRVEENTYIAPDGRRQCKECGRINVRAKRQRQRESKS